MVGNLTKICQKVKTQGFAHGRGGGRVGVLGEGGLGCWGRGGGSQLRLTDTLIRPIYGSDSRVCDSSAVLLSVIHCLEQTIPSI